METLETEKAYFNFSRGKTSVRKVVGGSELLGGYFGDEEVENSEELWVRMWAAATLNLTFSRESGISEPSCCFWVSHLADLGAGVRSLEELEDFVQALLSACPHGWPPGLTSNQLCLEEGRTK